MAIARRRHFVYHQSMDAEGTALSKIAAAIGEPARARMLCHLLDGRARTSTELAIVAGVSPATASVHLQRLRSERLVSLLAQGRHRYYSLAGRHVAAALEALNVLAGGTSGGRSPFVPSTPDELRAARTCYDHIAGALGVALHDRFLALGWLARRFRPARAYELTPGGCRAFAALGVDVDAARARRRRFAYPCLDWSERRPHLGGAIGAAVLDLALERRWVLRDPDGRALSISRTGRRELLARLGIQNSSAALRAS